MTGHALQVSSSWEVFAVVDGSEVLGAIFRIGREIHIEVCRPLYLRPLIRQVLRPDSVTKVREGHPKGHTFVKRLGFEEVGRSNGVVMYEMKRIKHV